MTAPTARVETLLTGTDAFALVSRQIAAILVVEFAQQRALADSANVDPAAWDVRVFRERSTPWHEFLLQPDSEEQLEDARPLVNIWFDTDAADKKARDPVRRSTMDGTYHVDCYAPAVATATAAGHDPADREAADKAFEVASKVRGLLLAPHWIDLGMAGVVASREVTGRTSFQPQEGDDVVQHVRALRVSLGVRFIETVVQPQTQPLELLSVVFEHADTGEILAQSDFPFSP